MGRPIREHVERRAIDLSHLASVEETGEAGFGGTMWHFRPHVQGGATVAISVWTEGEFEGGTALFVEPASAPAEFDGTIPVESSIASIDYFLDAAIEGRVSARVGSFWMRYEVAHPARRPSRTYTTQSHASLRDLFRLPKFVDFRAWTDVQCPPR